MSIFFICSMTFMTLSALARSLSCNILTRAVGTICHDTPYLSFSQPHCCAYSSPPADSSSQYQSTSACVSQGTWKEIASLTLKTGPPGRNPRDTVAGVIEDNGRLDIERNARALPGTGAYAPPVRALSEATWI